MSLQGREFVCNRTSNVIYFICYSLTRARITVAYELVSMFVLCSIDVGMCAMCACDAQLHACARDMGACVTSSSTFIHFQSFSCCRFAMSLNPTVLACFSPLQFPLYLPPDVAKTYEIAETLVAYIRMGRLQNLQMLQMLQTMGATGFSLAYPAYHEYSAERAFARHRDFPFRITFDETIWSPDEFDDTFWVEGSEYTCGRCGSDFDDHN